LKYSSLGFAEDGNDLSGCPDSLLKMTRENCIPTTTTASTEYGVFKWRVITALTAKEKRKSGDFNWSHLVVFSVSISVLLRINTTSKYNHKYISFGLQVLVFINHLQGS
jgi:hypothetical protein